MAASYLFITLYDVIASKFTFPVYLKQFPNETEKASLQSYQLIKQHCQKLSRLLIKGHSPRLISIQKLAPSTKLGLRFHKPRGPTTELADYDIRFRRRHFLMTFAKAAGIDRCAKINNGETFIPRIFGFSRKSWPFCHSTI